MIHNDIINPLLNDFLTRVTGFGGQFFKSSAITRLNDFVDYLSELTYPEFDFAFYPLRQDQNIGRGNTAFGIGYLSSGTNVFFPNGAIWTENGVRLESQNNCGEIDFSGKVAGDFQFRTNECSIFYFLQHTRQSFPVTFYRPNTDRVPYFCFDISTDHFSVTSPNFSKNRLRQRGTTYIYDEIYGEDQKGLQIDWSQKDTEKFYLPQSFSFYQMDKDRPSGQFICINANISFDDYSLRTIYGKDPSTLTGKFLPPYSSRPTGIDPGDRKTTEYFFPRRMVIGAGVSNMAERYDVDPAGHLCPGVLILKGNYLNKADEIARKMSEGVGIINETFISYTTTKETSNFNASINSIKYIESIARPLPPYTEKTSFGAQIKSILLKLIGIVKFDLFDWGAWGKTSLEWVDFTSEISGFQKTGIIDYAYPTLGSSTNKPITGFVSGFLNNNNREIFAPGTSNSKSGYYFINELGNLDVEFFPPYKTLLKEYVVGFISGYRDDFGNFAKLNNDLFVSGYYLNNEIFYLNPDTGRATKEIIGYVSGTIDRSNNFSGFHESNINQTSGYINSNLIQFPPYKYVSGSEPVIGYLKGFLSNDTFIPFADNQPLFDEFGNITGYAELTDPDISGYFYKNIKIPFPTGNQFVGFSGMPYFYDDLGYEFSGFFVNQSGLLFNQEEMTGFATGYIGSKAAIYSSGTFNEFTNIQLFPNSIGHKYSGFFAEGPSGFSGVIDLWDQYSNFNFMTGILTGYIGSFDYIQNINTLINFDGKSGFDPISGYAFSGFFIGNSGFSGINGDQFGLGVMTGIIGYRIVSDDGIVQFQGFTGIPNIDSTYYSNVFVNFDQATGFSGINNSISGSGIFTGIISSGNFAGNISKFSASTGISKFDYDFAVSGLFYGSGVIPVGELLSKNNLYSGEYPHIVGFISGCVDISGNFSTGILINQNNKIGSSGFFISGQKYFLPTGNDFSGFKYIPELNYPILALVSGKEYVLPGFFDFSGIFNEFSETGFVDLYDSCGILTGYIGLKKYVLTGIYLGSGKINSFEYTNFRATAKVTKYSDGIYDAYIGSGGFSGENKILSGEYPPVIGFLSGYINQYGQFTGFNILEPQKNSYGYYVSGIQYFLPTGDYFSGFEYVYWLNAPGGFDFSGFFASHIHTGYIGPQPGSGILTGYIGTRQFYISPASGALCTGASGQAIWCPENIYFSGSIPNVFYKTGFIDVVIETGFTGFLGFSGFSGFSGLGPDISIVFPSGDFVSGSCNIKSIEYFAGQEFEIYPYIRATSGFVNISVNLSIGDYFEDMPDFGATSRANFGATINSTQYYSLSNEYSMSETGIVYGPNPFSISTDPIPSESDNINYRVIPLLLTGTFPIIITPPSVSAISDIEGLTQDPYFDNVVLLLNMSGKNLSTDLVDTSKYHHKIVASLNTLPYSYSGFYNISGAENVEAQFSVESGVYELTTGLNIDSPFSSESGIYELSGLNRDSLQTNTETSIYSVTGFDNINPDTGYNYLVESGNYQVSVFETINPITGHGYLQESGNYTVSVSGTINSYESLLYFKIYQPNETGAQFGLSGNSRLNYDIFKFAETASQFGLSGNTRVNYDTYKIIETGAQVGVSGVILINGQF